MTQPDPPPSSVHENAPRRRWGLPVGLALLAVLVVLGGLWMKRRMFFAEIVSPGVLVVEIDQGAFADGYYRLLSERNWQIVRESSRGSVRDAVKLPVGRSERTFRMEDGMEVIVDTTHDGDRHIVFLGLRPPGEGATPEQMRQRSDEIAHALIDAWRKEAERGRWKSVKKLLR